MGQRHQIYLRLPKVYYGKGNPNNKSETTIGIHHQWLYGATALHFLTRLIDFKQKLDADDSDYYFSKRNYDPNEVLKAIYSCDTSIGYYHGVHKLGSECKNPFLGDNNNGITVIDFADPAGISYCFLSLTHLECLREGIVERNEFQGDVDKGFYTNLEPISASEWIDLHYTPDQLDKAYEENPGNTVGRARSNLYKLKDVRVMTSGRLNQIFKDLPQLKRKADEAYKKEMAKWKAKAKAGAK